MIDPAEHDAWVEICKQGIVVGSLFGAFTMNSAFNSFSNHWENKYHKYASISALASSICFICMVCISALVVFVHSAHEFTEFTEQSHGLDIYNTYVPLLLTNLALGVIGIVSMLFMFAFMGWEKGKALGRLTSSIAIVCVLVLAWSVYIVATEFVLQLS